MASCEVQYSRYRRWGSPCVLKFLCNINIKILKSCGIYDIVEIRKVLVLQNLISLDTELSVEFGVHAYRYSFSNKVFLMHYRYSIFSLTMSLTLNLTLIFSAIWREFFPWTMLYWTICLSRTTAFLMTMTVLRYGSGNCSRHF